MFSTKYSKTGGVIFLNSPQKQIKKTLLHANYLNLIGGSLKQSVNPKQSHGHQVKTIGKFLEYFISNSKLSEPASKNVSIHDLLF